MKLQSFSYPSVLTFVLGAHKNRLIEMVLLSTINICFGWEIRKIIFDYTLLSDGPIIQALCRQNELWSRYGFLLAHYISWCLIVCLIWFFRSKSTFFQSCRDRSSWVEPVQSRRYSVLLKDTMQCLRCGSNQQLLNLESSTLPLSHALLCVMFKKCLNHVYVSNIHLVLLPLLFSTMRWLFPWFQ